MEEVLCTNVFTGLYPPYTPIASRRTLTVLRPQETTSVSNIVPHILTSIQSKRIKILTETQDNAAHCNQDIEIGGVRQ